MSSDVATLHAACVRDLGDPQRWFSPRGYPDSLAQCVIDSIYSTGARYATVEKIIARYRGYRAAQGADAETDGVTELLQNIAELGGPDAWASQIGNRRPTSTAAGAPLKSIAIAQAAQVLVALGIRTAHDLRAAVEDEARRAKIKAAWCAVPGQRSGITWEYAQILAQIPGVKADRMVLGYVCRAVGPVDAARAAELVRATAEAGGWGVIELDHAIWRFESGRPCQRDVPA
ncbi:heme peroxidase [Mycolicibacterium neworleansense]|uniref:Heme peroxidase superfamily protein n=1 Tax=Mycolicibacterium neworleansense TaxID=146018 RepID=A0A0H5RLC4_9MYCO|nr:heme peroxidase [Mycolicibacterium neworleansense]MCV7360411.1 heme peroxidase [Mycolicibacterium neworleansense]CRZ14581.1 heme peroxidase superfamily protein [Mycolicibacterium neworleansense]